MALITGTVTFLFTDIEGSTRMWEEHPDAMRMALSRHNGLVAEAITNAGGQVFKTVGDAFCCAFGRADEALAAAVAAQQRLLAEPWPEGAVIRVRMALHTGTVTPEADDYFGPTLNRIARLLSLGHGGQVLLSGVTRALLPFTMPKEITVRELGRYRLRDIGEPEQVFQLALPGLPSEFAALRSLSSEISKLPTQLTSFVGREREMADLRALLESTRLLTLTGSGGIGKTRLALALAGSLSETYPYGACFVQLAPLNEAESLAQAVGTAVGVKEEPGKSWANTLMNALRSCSILIVLDNCEHLLVACATLAQSLLESCPGVRLLATSRQSFGISGETVYQAPPLATDRSDLENENQGDGSSAADDSPAVRLFVERAAQALPSFKSTPSNAEAVSQICQRLDGIPLALELAAARVKSISVEQIANRLDHSLRLLTGGNSAAHPRHRTLRAALDWSFGSLSDAEQAALRRLSAFTGGWTLEAAERVTTDEFIDTFDVLDLMASLTDKSMILFDGEGRYRMLEPVREYALELLEASGEGVSIRDRHLEFFKGMAESAAPHLEGTEQARWLQTLQSDHANLLAGLQWACEAKPDAAMSLANDLRWFWINTGRYAEGERWVQAALDRNADASDGVRACGLNALASLTIWHNIGLGRRSAEEGLELARRGDDWKCLARLLSSLSVCLLWQGERERAADLAKEALPLCRRLKEPFPLANSLLISGCQAVAEGDLQRATEMFKESIEFSRSVKDFRSQTFILYFLAGLSLLRNDVPAARVETNENLKLSNQIGWSHVIAHAQEMDGRVLIAESEVEQGELQLLKSLRILRQTAQPQCCSHNLEGFAHLALVRGEDARAARILGAIRSILSSRNLTLLPIERIRLENSTREARGRLHEADYENAVAEGQSMDLEEAIEYALRGDPPHSENLSNLLG